MNWLRSRLVPILWAMAALSMVGWLIVNLDTAGWILLTLTIGLMAFELTRPGGSRRDGDRAPKGPRVPDEPAS